MARRTKSSADRLIDAISSRGSPLHEGTERRREKRLEYDCPVSLVIVGPTGHCGSPITVQGCDLSYEGMCVTSRSMVYEGSTGAVQLMRSTGEMAIVGVQVRNCKYVGAMQHRVGLQFIPLPLNLPSSAFIDRNGRMTVLDQSLKHEAA